MHSSLSARGSCDPFLRDNANDLLLESSDPELVNMLSTKYNDESYVTTLPTVEQLRYVANQYVRLRNLSKYPTA